MFNEYEEKSPPQKLICYEVTKRWVVWATASDLAEKKTRTDNPEEIKIIPFLTGNNKQEEGE